MFNEQKDYRSLNYVNQEVSMKKYSIVCIYLGLSFFGSLGGAHPSSHAKHNMILFGENEVFASHIVYKVPHNFQVILSLNLDSHDLKEYHDARAANPDSQFIYLLDEMNIKDINSVDLIRGRLMYIDSNDQKHEVIKDLVLTKEK